MITRLNISMVTECNMTTEKSEDWWYDSGATVHICNSKNFFKKNEVVTKDEKVLMENHDTARVLGKGTHELQFTSGKKIILTNVFHVPDVRKNIVSSTLLCKSGLKAMLEAEKIIFSKNGVFVGQGFTCDGMFKLSINKIQAYVYIVSSFDLWHARLTHVNHRSIKFMKKHGMKNCDNTNFEKCETCIQ